MTVQPCADPHVAIEETKAALSERDAFGPNLRRWRVRKGVSLDEIARQTRVAVDLWEGLERNDFSAWPSGIYARAYIREYAAAIGVDPDDTVDDFCRSFPQGDRRAERIVRGAADIVGHDLAWQDDVPRGTNGERRAAPATLDRLKTFSVQSLRVTAAAVDAGIVAAASGLAAAFLPIPFWPTLAIATLLYHGISIGVAGSTPAVLVVDAFVHSQPAIISRGPAVVFRRLEKERKDQPSTS